MKKLGIFTALLLCMAVSATLGKEFVLKEDNYGREYLHH